MHGVFGGGGGAGGDLVKLATVVVAGAATQTITFSGLNGDVEEVYYLTYTLPGFDPSAQLELRPNNGTSSMASRRHLHGGSNTHLVDSFTKLLLMDANGGSNVHAHGYTTFFAKTGAARGYIGECFGRNSGDFYSQLCVGEWADTTTNLTSLVIYATTSPGFAIGSRVTLYRLQY